ncbi:MAG: hypothetical protein HRU11_11540, partial [Parvularculaceae bacterium]|nr:hypothetical protein [Parvularculaceae bacterium]
MTSSKQRLALGTATIALLASLPTTAWADCSIEGTTITCDADATVDDVNAALNALGGADVSLIVLEGVAIDGQSTRIQLPQLGAVSINNAGTVGDGGFNDGIYYFGDPSSTENSFSVVNSGLIDGAINLSGVGGDVDIVSEGDVSSTIYAFALGDLTATVNGRVGRPSDEVRSEEFHGVTLQSGGGTTSIVIGQEAVVGSLASTGRSGASVNVRGRVGSAERGHSVAADAFNTTFNSEGIFETGDGFLVSGFTDHIVAVGGAAEISVSETAVVWGSAFAQGLTQ